ncbi:DUF6241 domain-containing protein [Alkalihalobacterium chitinilyticum]|uniref:DUF6241 domain-containing protein n=1 Tax=Alkalihalobacterium chitinilyticum TaxID=2980103 RepID=A0ABT5VJ31_9BACI|nr:DUF6241 domain-containing protein [Alkalihalobacterium chitinilyticum]MDE5415463.1 DUF6241 domain-containing protein [Alkalihalobacterium chitinilyticum]
MKTSRILFIAIALIIAVVIYAFNALSNHETLNKLEPAETSQTSEPTPDNEEEPIIGNIPTAEEVEEEFPLDLPERAVQNYIHWMSHQKVAASQKWGHMQITQERIERLIEVVEANNYSYGRTYLDILERWQKGDFSQADEDHNRIWRLQGGTVGEATRVFTPEEEAEYIRKHFE